MVLKVIHFVPRKSSGASLIMSRLKPDCNLKEAIIALCDGNPGAMHVVLHFVQSNNFLPLLTFDSLELYGEKLYMLWNDCCGRDFGKLLRVITWWHLGKLSKEEIHEHVSGVYGKPFEEIEDKAEVKDGKVRDAPLQA